MSRMGVCQALGYAVPQIITANERSEASLAMLRKIENDRDASLSLYKAVVGADCPTTIGCLGEGGECISRD